MKGLNPLIRRAAKMEDGKVEKEDLVEMYRRKLNSSPDAIKSLAKLS